MLTADVPTSGLHGERIYHEGTVGTVTVGGSIHGIDAAVFDPDIGQRGFFTDDTGRRTYYTGDQCLVLQDGPNVPAAPFCQPCDMVAGCCHHSVLVR